MTRTAKTPHLMSHIAEPFVEVHPRDAARFGLADATLARVTSTQGSAILRVLITDRQRPGSLFAPMHWTDQYASAGRVDALVAAARDPVSGQPALKSTHVRIEPLEPAWYGFTVLREKPANIPAEYWALAPAKSGWRIEMAGMRRAEDWSAFARVLLHSPETDILAYHDATSGQHRFAAFTDHQLSGALFVAREPVDVARSWAAEQLAVHFDNPTDRLRMLAGRAGGSVKDRGAIVCACFEVGHNEIAEAATTAKCATVDAIGASLKAGTNCGSCRAEIGRIIHAARLPKAG